VVLCSEILEHVDNFEATLAEMTRVLKPGGRLYATMPNELGRVWGPLRGVCRVVDDVEGHLRRMRLEDFCAAGERLGLRAERTQYRGFVLSALWYRLFIYSPRVKERGMAMISVEDSLASRLLQRLTYSGMRLYLWGDFLFNASSRCMGFDVLFVKRVEAL
jgi:SAM-dependent methyltransferase